MKNRIEKLTDLAVLLELTVEETTYLPASVKHIAEATEKSEAEIVRHLRHNEPFRDYVVGQIRTHVFEKGVEEGMAQFKGENRS